MQAGDQPSAKQLLYFTIFCSQHYVELWHILLESMVTAGWNEEDIDILVITDAHLVAAVLDVAAKYQLHMQTWVVPDDHVGESVFKASEYRLRIFDWSPGVRRYDKFVYMDVDVVVLQPGIGRIFRAIDLPDKLYAASEDTIQHAHMGRSLFDQDEHPTGEEPDEKQAGFNCGVLGFQNSPQIQELFAAVLKHIARDQQKGGALPPALEQPYVVFHTIRRNMHAGAPLTEFVSQVTCTSKTPAAIGNCLVRHFPGNPGRSIPKQAQMEDTRRAVWRHRHAAVADDIDHHVACIRLIIETFCDRAEGNYFYKHGTLEHEPLNVPKQINMYNIGRDCFPMPRLVCEIGFNAGHSAMLWMLGFQSRWRQERLAVVLFDIGTNPYTRACVAFFSDVFGSTASVEYQEGNSATTVQQHLQDHPGRIGAFDFVHVDGDHRDPVFRVDLEHALQMTRRHGLILVDDSNIPHIDEACQRLVAQGRVETVPRLAVTGHTHTLLRKL